MTRAVTGSDSQGRITEESRDNPDKNNRALLEARHDCIVVFKCCLVVLQDLSWCEAETLADVVQLAELVNGGAALLGNRCE